jgi:hypothetical protein
MCYIVCPAVLKIVGDFFFRPDSSTNSTKSVMEMSGIWSLLGGPPGARR